MDTPGRPTPQRVEDNKRPRFRDRVPEGDRQQVNPYLSIHANFGPQLLTADQAWRFRGRWHECFQREAPLHLEIGSGNGFFLEEYSRRNPEINVLGVEIRYKRTVLTARKLKRAGVTNARIARYHAAFLDDLFEPGSLSAIIVNHPDPWPKDRHEKNRLISGWFLSDVASLLHKDGVFWLKSDFKPNVDRVQELLKRHPELPLRITGRSEDVNSSPAPWPDDIETNYQSKFRKKGQPVYAVEVVRT